MKLDREITINKRLYPKGAEISWLSIYPFFMVHMLMFGGSGFVMSYSPLHLPLEHLLFIYIHGGIAIAVYTFFYLTIFGADEVKWMFINSGLGLLGIYAQVGWLLSRFGRKIGDYPLYVHVTPFLYYVLYTFLLRNALLDIFAARENEQRRNAVDNLYIAFSVASSLVCYFLERH